MQYGTFVWDADGDMGDAVLLGPVRTEAAAEKCADEVRDFAEREGTSVNTMVIPIVSRNKTTLSMVSDRVRGG
jgi:hypothetical protein